MLVIFTSMDALAMISLIAAQRGAHPSLALATVGTRFGAIKRNGQEGI